jgi:diguanylate cyclase
MGAGRAADRRLGPFVALVIAVGAGCIGLTVPRVSAPSSILYLGVVVGLVAVAMNCGLKLRTGGESHRVTCLSATTLVALAALPYPWALICVAAGVTIAGVTGRRTATRQIAFNTARNAIGMAAAIGALKLCNLDQNLHVRHGMLGIGQLAALTVAALGYAVIDELLTPSAIAMASHLPWRAIVLRDWDIRLSMRLANFGVACLTVALLDFRRDLILAMPFALASVYLAGTQRMHRRAEARAARHLALATADLLSPDLTTVLHRGAQAALRLLSAAEADVEARIGDNSWLVRAQQDSVVYDGPALDAPQPGNTNTFVLGDNSGRTTAVLRIRFNNPTTLSDQERETLEAFSYALNSAVGNAHVDERAVRPAGDRDHAATHDPLTGLGNRRYLEERGARLIQEPGQHAVALIDLNRIKQVNDTLGHTAGDQLIVEIAHRLAGGVTNADIVARLGGDEFTVIFADLVSPIDGVRRIQKLLDSVLAEPVDLHGIHISVEAAAGIAAGPAAGGVAELLRRADVAMYQAKRQGRRVCSYRPDRDTGGYLTSNGQRSPAARTDQVVVTFQPMVDLTTGHLIGAHALTSWQYPGRRRINPQQLALEHPTVLPAYSRHVLDLTLQAVATWRAAGRNLPALVHVAARSLLEADFASDLQGRLERAGVPADQLTIELSETLLHANFGAVNTTIRTLASMGVRLGLTEFGAGASSLAALAQLPVHQLTVAPQLISQIDRPAIAAVTRSILDLGRNLDLVVVADGIDTEAQRRTLVGLGCNTGRGSLFGDPLSAKDLVIVPDGASMATLARTASRDDGAVVS